MISMRTAKVNAHLVKEQSYKAYKVLLLNPTTYFIYFFAEITHDSNLVVVCIPMINEYTTRLAVNLIQ